MGEQNIDLMAHLMRRAGFGATRDEVERLMRMGFDAAVERLLHPKDVQTMDDDLIRRYQIDQSELRALDSAAANWMYRMISTDNPLEEKLTLFWHSLFATGYAKVVQARVLLNQIDMFRRHGLGSFHTLLVELSKDPAMIIWLDNVDNHDGAINENYGRELLELFSMGIGNYSEDDVKEASRAFTGWTLGNADYMAVRAMKDSIWPYGRIAWHFEYNDADHDDGSKTFLGETGNFNGEEIVGIIVKQEATARFVCTRLFHFFVADEIDDEGEQLVQAMMSTYFDSDYEIRAVLRTLFKSEYFKSDSARFARIKAPVETVVGAIRTAGSYAEPTLGVNKVAIGAMAMGQYLLSPPTVEGWHEGVEWIDSGALVERVNFAAGELGDATNPGVRAIIDRIADEKEILSADGLVDRCLDIIGPLPVAEETRSALVEFAGIDGDLDLSNHQHGDESERRVADVLRLIASTREYQLA